MTLEKFRLTEENYRYLFDNASDAMWIRDLEGNMIDANRACERLTGYTHEEVLAKNIKSFFTGESLELAKEVRRKLLNGESVSPYEQRLIRKDGKVRTIELASSLVVIGGKPVGFQHIARDITEEKQLQANLHFYVQLITRAQEEERKRIARELHDDAAPSLLLIIQQLDVITSHAGNEFSQALKDRLEDLRRYSVDALQGLRRCAHNLRPRIIDDLGLVAALEWLGDDLMESCGLEVKVKAVGTVRQLSDEVQVVLFRIAQEALSNIRKHAEAARVWISLEFGAEKIILTIKDDGKGFEIPERAGDLAGFGKLGLVGMHERAQLIGGKLILQSAPKKGTTITIELPL